MQTSYLPTQLTQHLNGSSKDMKVIHVFLYVCVLCEEIIIRQTSLEQQSYLYGPQLVPPSLDLDGNAAGMVLHLHVDF